MDQITFYLPIKPISYNQAHCVNRGRIQNTKKNNQFKRDIRNLLLPFTKDIRQFASEQIIQYGGLAIKYIFWIPEAKLITAKEKMVSKTSLDIDNCVKSLQDSIFSVFKYYNSQIDDALIIDSYKSKRISPKDEYGITCHISRALIPHDSI